jgi:hypothetical protein
MFATKFVAVNNVWLFYMPLPCKGCNNAGGTTYKRGIDDAAPGPGDHRRHLRAHLHAEQFLRAHRPSRRVGGPSGAHQLRKWGPLANAAIGAQGSSNWKIDGTF